jgi:hypothetical protein
MWKVVSAVVSLIAMIERALAAFDDWQRRRREEQITEETTKAAEEKSTEEITRRLNE